MKTLKILFAAAIIAGFATSAMAQDSSASANADATARVLAEIDITKDEDINWGDVAQGASPNLSPADGEVTAAGLNDSETTFGKFTVVGTQGASIIISYEHNDLTGPGEEIIWDPALSYLGGIDADEDEDVAGNSDSTFGGNIVSDGGNVLLGEGGIGMVFVGGGLTIGADQMPGTYTGDIKVTVEYN